MKNKKINLILLIFAILVIALENFAYLVPSSSYIINGFLKYSDIGLVLSLFWFISVMFFIKKKDENKKIKYPYKYFIISFIMIFFIGTTCIIVNKGNS